MHIPQIPPQVKLVAVTKTQSADRVLEAISLGITDIGENYVQEAEEKFKIIGKSVKWHLIGHLQSNKVKKAVDIFDVIQSVDSIKIADLINKECIFLNKNMPVMIEVNLGREESKNGIELEKLGELILHIRKLSNLRLIGLMTMCKKEYFSLMHEIYLKSRTKYLSMGMSGDYIEAIKSGSNMVRIGSAIFGERK